MSLKGSKTEGNLKDAFAGESQATVQQRKAKPDMPTGTWNTWKNAVILLQVYPLVAPVTI